MASMRFLVCTLCLMVAAACGSVNNELPDGPPGQPDAPNEPDARTTGVIQVTVVTDYGDVDSNGDQLPIGIPRQGAQVFFIEPDGTSHLVTTGGNGIARSPDVHPGTAALVVRPQSSTEYAITAFFALAPDMSITAGPGVDTYVPTSTVGSLTINVPAMSGATGYGLSPVCWSSYGQTGTPPVFTLSVVDPCDRTQRTLLALAYDSNGLRGYSSRVIDYTPGTTITMPAFQNAVNFVANLSNLPSVVSGVNMYGNYREGDGWLGSFGFYGEPTNGAAVLQGGTAPTGDSLEFDATFYTITGNTGRNRLTRRVTGTPTTTAIDGSAMLPFITYPEWDAATRTVSWDELGTTNRADVMISRGYYSVSNGNINVNFTLIGPHVADSLTLPELPTEVAHLTPTAADGGYAYETLLVDDVASAGYADVVPTADADARNAVYGFYGQSTETWISGGFLD